MNNETTSKLRERELERMSAQYYCRRRERAMNEELARIGGLPFDRLPCDEEEKQELYGLAKERLSELEEEIPAFKDYCEKIRKTEWPKNLYEEIFHEPILLKEGAKEKMRSNLGEFPAIERECILKLFCEKKPCDEICEELNIYPTELKEQFLSGLRRLRHPRYNRNVGQYLVILEEGIPFSEVAAACKSEEEFQYALGQVPTTASQRKIPDSLKSEAIALVRSHPEERITTLFLQKNLKIPYPEAATLKDMFCVGPEDM